MHCARQPLRATECNHRTNPDSVDQLIPKWNEPGVLGRSTSPRRLHARPIAYGQQLSNEELFSNQQRALTRITPSEQFQTTMFGFFHTFRPPSRRGATPGPFLSADS